MRDPFQGLIHSAQEINQQVFCANPLCRFHVECSFDAEHVEIVGTQGFDYVERIHSRRHLAYKRSPDRELRRFFLCDCCN